MSDVWRWGERDSLCACGGLMASEGSRHSAYVCDDSTHTAEIGRHPLGKVSKVDHRHRTITLQFIAEPEQP